jgi:hypothetical protein
VSVASAHFRPLPLKVELRIRNAGGAAVALQDGTYTYVYGLDLISMTDSGGSQKYLCERRSLGARECGLLELATGERPVSTASAHVRDFRAAEAPASGFGSGTFVYDVFGAVMARTGSGRSGPAFAARLV